MRYTREIIGAIAFILVLFTLYISLIHTGPAKFFTAPNAQKLFYFHVPSGLITYLAFMMVVGGSAFYLYNKSDYADKLSKCSAELGLVFGFMSLASGTSKCNGGSSSFHRSSIESYQSHARIT